MTVNRTVTGKNILPSVAPILLQIFPMTPGANPAVTLVIELNSVLPFFDYGQEFV